MNSTHIFNRAAPITGPSEAPDSLTDTYALPADGWSQIEVNGSFEVPSPFVTEGGDESATITLVIDERARELIVNQLNTMAEEADEQRLQWPGMLVDLDHHSHDPDKDTIARGWLQTLRQRDTDGAGEPVIEGQIRWTGVGRKQVEGGEVRFFSTEYAAADLEEIEPGVYRPTRLAGLALTNRPRRTGGKPISNRADTDVVADEKPRQQPDTTMTNIAKKLGLDPSATEEEILAAIESLQADHTEAEADAVEAIMNRYAEHIPADQKETIRAAVVLNRKAAEPMLSLLAQAKPQAGDVSILNRAGSKVPVSDGEDEAATTAKAKRRADLIRNRASELRTATPGLSLNDAYDRAAQEIPSE